MCFYYVDDIHIVEPDESASEAKAMLQEVVAMLGWQLDAAKSQAMPKRVTSLGCELQIKDQRHRMAPERRKAREVDG